MSKDSQRLKIFKIAQECNGSPTRISYALIDAGFRDVGELKEWLEKRKEKWDKKDSNRALGHLFEIIDVLDKLESL
jgi:hypothetical protein